MLLDSKNAMIFAATGAIASGVARRFAKEGATVWLSGRNESALMQLADSIGAEGGKACVDVVDATDTEAVTNYVNRVAQAGSIDVMFNGIGARPVDLGYPIPAAKVTYEQFMIPFEKIVWSTFLTSRAVGGKMAETGGGSIITLTATLSVMTAPFMENIVAASAAIEGLTRSLAGEFGPVGVRVNCVRGNAMPETRTIQETGAGYAELGYNIPMVMPPLGRPISVDETAKTAAFLASDLASGMTGQVVTVSAGAFV